MSGYAFMDLGSDTTITIHGSFVFSTLTATPTNISVGQQLLWILEASSVGALL